MGFIIFVLSFFTSDSCKSKLFIENNEGITVSDEFIVNHKKEIPLAGALSLILAILILCSMLVHRLNPYNDVILNKIQSNINA